ncbi:hypothetical protein GCM10010266_67400 [Streptomyces griseomycini]|nr:hypothetical protein GCM10010266_67400 [Streptomyces griseomycini]
MRLLRRESRSGCEGVFLLLARYRRRPLAPAGTQGLRPTAMTAGPADLRHWCCDRVGSPGWWWERLDGR